MGQAAFTIAGQVVGAYFGGPVGAAIGGAIGSAIGGALFPTQLPTIEGPRMDDLAVQSSAYGKAVPIAYGTIRIAGNLIWSSGLRETRTETELGGKGSGPQQSQVAYSYDADFAIAIGNGTISHIRRMWFNGIQVYDDRPPDEMEAAYGSLDAAMRARNASIALQEFFVWYPGDTSQLPDPTIEATEGAGNVPAYRGTAYIVFTRYQLAMWGNRLPQVEVEVVTSATDETGGQIAYADGLTPWFRHGTSPSQSDYLPIVSTIADGIRVFGSKYSDDGLHLTEQVRVYGFDAALINTDYKTDMEASYRPMGWIGGGQINEVWIMAEGGALRYLNAGSTTAENPFRCWVDEGANGIHPLDGHLPHLDIGGISVCADREHLLVTMCNNDGVTDNVVSWYLLRYAAQTFTLIDTGAIDDTGGNSTSRINWGTSPCAQYNGHQNATMLESDLRHLWRYASTEVEVWEIDDETGVLSLIHNYGSITGLSSDDPASMHCDNGTAVFIAGSTVEANGSIMGVYTRLGGISSTAVPLDEIVSDISERCTLEPADSNVTDLADVDVRGFVIGKQMNGRAGIEALMRGFNFDAAEDGSQIIYRRRDHDPTIELLEDDLGAGSESASPHLIESKRAQETELPQEVSVLYFDVDADYRQGAQAAHRTTTLSHEKLNIQLPIAMTADEAAQAADVLLYQMWTSRNQRSFATSQVHSELIPTDTITITADGFSVVVRLTKKMQEDSLIKWEALDVDPATFSSNAVGVSLPLPPVISVLKPSRIQVLDIPALRYQDNDAGLYLAVSPSSSGMWPGAAVLAAGNLFGPFQKVAEAFLASSVGYAEAEIAPFYGGNVFDELTECVVVMTYGAPTSATELEVLNGANVGVLGNEIIQWKTATSLGDSRYRLSGLLRGRRATEAEMLTHSSGERFVIISQTATVRLPLGAGVIGTQAIYRPVTFGGNANPLYDESVTHTGASLKPAAPCNVSGVRTADGVVLRWSRRDRLSWDWVDGEEIELSETTEAYTIEIMSEYTNGYPIRTITNYPVNEYLYTLAQEAEDFPDEPDPPQEILTVRISQQSTAVGRGFPALVLLTGLYSF